MQTDLPTNMQRIQAIIRHVQPRAAAVFNAGARRTISSTVTAASSHSAPHASSASAAPPAEEPAPVRITPHPNGCLTMSLHRPKALNALNLPMIRLLTSGLKSLSKHKHHSKCVLVYGEGDKAFCAGGDIRALAQPASPRDPPNFFREEYQLNHLIHSTSRAGTPYVAVLRGITMGGGVGISVHGSVRIVTDNTMFAMPETGIGLFPDVGGSWFLPRLPGAIGMYLALTGQALGAADTLYAGVGTHFIPQASIAAFIHDLEHTPELSKNPSGALENLLKHYATAPPSDKPDSKLKSFLASRRALIDRVFSAESYEGVLQRLESEAASESNSADDKAWLHSVLKTLSTKSPTSLLITFHAMQEGAKARSLQQCLEMELRLGARITAEAAKGGDFAEGVKAVLIDKKHKPQWAPKPTMQQIVDKYFAPFKPEEQIEEFKL